MICSLCDNDLDEELFAKRADSPTGRQYYCRKCHRDKMREFRARRPGAEAERYRTDPEFRKKCRARSRMTMRVARGQARPSCEGCGDPKGQFHHDDYDRPADTRGLCKTCHGAHHYPQAQPGAIESRLAEIAAKVRARQELVA